VDYLRLKSPTTIAALAIVVLVIIGIVLGTGAMLQAALLAIFCFGVYAILRLLRT
jgi:hypothetical protein